MNAAMQRLLNLEPVRVPSRSNSNRKPVPVFFPGHLDALERKPQCACGGGCPRCQSKLPISSPGDRQEQEADRVAEQILSLPGPANSSAPTSHSRGKRVTSEDQGGLGPGKPLDDATRAFMEPRFGVDLGHVRVHTDARAATAASEISARAYTIGHDVGFASGEYAPSTFEGKRLLAHELAHVVQQDSAQDASPRLQRAVRSVSCQNPTGRVREIVGDDPVGTVEEADALAMQFLENTIDVVAGVQERIRGGEGAGWPTMSDTLGVALRDHFAVNPEDREVWTSTAPVTGDGRPTITTLLLRLRRTRDVLAGGVRYRCLDRPPCPPMSQPDEVVLGAIAFTDPDEHRVSLCEGFWRREGSLGLSASDRALVLVHEAFHMYFAGTDNGRSMWNASCIEIFVADLNNIRPSEFSSAEDCCKPGAVCALL